MILNKNLLFIFIKKIHAAHEIIKKILENQSASAKLIMR